MRKTVSLTMRLAMAAALLIGVGFVTRMSADHAAPGLGVILDLDGSSASQGRPDVAWNRGCDSFLAVYDRKRTDVDYNIYGRYADGDGLTAGPGPFAITTNVLKQQNPAVAYNPGGGNFVVVWQDYRNDMWEIWAQRVGCDKNLIGDPIRITTNENITHYQLNPDVACGYMGGQRSGCWVVWEDFRNGNWDIYGQKLTSGGLLEGGNIRVTPQNAWQRNAAIAYNPERTGCDDGSFMVVWDDTRNAAQNYGSDIYAQQLGWTGLCGGNLPVYKGAADQRVPDIAYGTGNDRYQVVWEDARNSGNWDVYAGRITANAAPAGPSFAIARDAKSTQSRPRVAYDAEFGNEFTTVWDDSRGGGLNVFQQRATGAGVLIGANAAVAANAPIESHAAIAYGEVSEHFFVVYVHEIDGIKGRAVWR